MGKNNIRNKKYSLTIQIYIMAKKIFVVVLYLLPLLLKAQLFSIDKAVPSVALIDTTKLTVLNARMGSRFSFSLITRDNGIHTGALGYDQDEFAELLIMIEAKGKKYCFRTANNPPGVTYLSNQQLRVGLTSTQLTGKTPEGLSITATIISPFTPSADINDVDNIKVQISPAYYILVEVVNDKNFVQTCKTHVGIKKIVCHNSTMTHAARVWVYGSKMNTLYYRDNTSLYAKLALSGRGNDRYHWGENGFNCLSKEFSLAPKATIVDTLIYAAYHNEEVIYDRKYNLPLHFYYTLYWKNLQEVIEYAQSNAPENIMLSQKFENLLKRSSVAPEEKWIIALSFHSDIANAFFLTDKKNKARFYLAEGRFRHLSTVDVAHETELMAVFAPWRLQIQIEQWLDYIARKEVDRGLNQYGQPHREGMTAAEYGPFIYHDVGDLPYVSETSDYSYGPHMAVEENCNYSLLLYWYWKLTGDDEYVKSCLGMLDVLLNSVINRDTDNNGLVDKAMGWTTFDNSKVLKKSPENVYLAIKQMTAYLVASEMFSHLAINNDVSINGSEDINTIDGKGIGYSIEPINNVSLRNAQAKKYREEAQKISNTLQAAYAHFGYLPCSIDTNYKNWHEQSITLGDGLLLPGLAGFSSDILSQIIPALKASYQKAYIESKMPYGIKLSSYQGNTWFSKVMGIDVVAAYWYGINTSSAIYAYRWNNNNFYCYNDGINDDGKTTWIGFWYPRGIVSLGYLFRERKFTAQNLPAFLQDIK